MGEGEGWAGAPVGWARAPKGGRGALGSIPGWARVRGGTGAAPAEEVRGEGGRDVRQVWKSWSAQFWGETPPKTQLREAGWGQVGLQRHFGNQKTLPVLSSVPSSHQQTPSAVTPGVVG